MKKTNKSPENVEVTPNKKKLKQARLPFMPLTDASPKSESPPSRKRKLSVPEVVPATKIGKISKENGITEALVVISDDDSREPKSPKKQEKLPNPYVKLVDAARKKKLQKSKRQKKSKSKSVQVQNPNDSGSQVHNDSTDNNESEDVEMVEVEALVHQNSEHNESNLQNGAKDVDKTVVKESNNNSKDRKSVAVKLTYDLNDSSDESSPKKQNKLTPKTIEQTNSPEKENETICIDDSNNSNDVKLQQTTTNELKNEEDKIEQKQQPEKQSKNKKPKSKSPANKRVSRSTKNKNNEQNTEQKDNSKADVDKDTDINALENKTSDQIEDTHKDDSDIEMVECKDSDGKPNESSDVEAKSEEHLTPKRSTRNKTKEGENMDVSTCSLLDESVTSNLSTPKQADKSLNESLKNLTPKQMAKRLEAIKRREEREKEKQERDKKRQQEKDERAKQRQEKEDQKKREREEKEEAKRKEREEKEEQRKKEKEEKDKLKELEKKAREEKEEAKKKEREEKEEQRRKEKEARDEERRKKQEALEIEKQEQELKLKKTKEAFVSFFVAKQKTDKESSPSETAPVSKSSMLSSFTVKADMRLAPTCRTELGSKRREVLDRVIQEQSPESNYLKLLRDGSAKPGRSEKTWPLDDKDDEVMIVEDELPPIAGAGSVLPCESAPREKLRPKLLSFHENRRPPYWGTWRKRSRAVTPRRPFGQEKTLEYEVDSDDDWEDEADGESLDGSVGAGGSDDEAGAGGDDYEVDNDVFVPHGYLSDEEATMEDEGDDVLSLSPETQKARLKHLEDEFESEMKKPTEKLKPRLYGLLWANSDGGKPDNCVDALWNYFEKFAMMMGDVTPLFQPAPEPEKDTEKKKIKKKKADDEEKSPKAKKKKEAKTESKDKKVKQEAKKSLANQPGINAFLKKVEAEQ